MTHTVSYLSIMARHPVVAICLVAIDLQPTSWLDGEEMEISSPCFRSALVRPDVLHVRCLCTYVLLLQALVYLHNSAFDRLILVVYANVLITAQSRV